MNRLPLCLLPVLLLFLLPSLLIAQTTIVPSTMEFAGMELKIKEGARRKIQEEVDALQKSSKYFQLKVERVDMYFPIIEKVFEEEGLPEDFKYLAIQESSLVSDAVSSSNAVGYWQFKKESALEVGLIVDSDVDDRKHIINSSRGAARYLKRNNFFLRNWVYALLSYNLGLGGTKSVIDEREIGAEKVEIDNKTHWYIIKFLAHKIAFQEVIGRTQQRPLTLLAYADCKGKTLSAIADDMGLPEDEVLLYNKWLSRRRVPEDRDYIVIIPAPLDRLDGLMAKCNVPSQGLLVKAPDTEEEFEAIKEAKVERDTRFPILKKKRTSGSRSSKGPVFYTINGKPGIQAQPGDNSTRLAQQAEISLDKFLSYNDLKRNEPLVPGEVYYLRKKRAKAKVHEHVVFEGETLWQISQKYGITVQALMRKNRMTRPDKLQHGRVLWLRFIRPANEPVEIKNIPKPTYAVNDEVAKTDAPAAKPAQTEKPKEEVKPASQAPPVKEVVPEKEPEVIVPDDEIFIPEEEETLPVPTKSKPAPAPLEEEVEESTYEVLHQVTAGQTLYAISKIYGVTVADLRSWNNLTENDSVKVGQTLVIRTTEASPTNQVSVPADTEEFIEYTVQQGDTLYKVAKLHNVSVGQLMEWNGKKEQSIAIGEKLKVKKNK